MQRAPTECGIQPSCINQDVCRIPQERCTPVFSGREAEAQPLPLRTWVMGEAQLRCETIALTLLMLTNVDQFFFVTANLNAISPSLAWQYAELGHASHPSPPFSLLAL